MDTPTVLDQIKEQMVTLAINLFNQNKEAAIADGKALLIKISSDLERWLILLGNGDLKEKEFTWLVNSDKSLIVMEALRTAGENESDIQDYVTQILSTVVSVAITALSK